MCPKELQVNAEPHLREELFSAPHHRDGAQCDPVATPVPADRCQGGLGFART